VHDRRLDGKTLVFGNAGGLYLGAMTWWDHKTQSIWSQPVGEAIAGELEGARLTLLPSQVTTWGNWVKAHPQTFVMINDVDRLSSRRQGFSPDFVIGVVIDQGAKAYYFEDVEKVGVVNDAVGDFPVLLWAAAGDFRVYLRTVQGKTLTFRLEGDHLVDEQTGSTWKLDTGLATDGPLRGEALQPAPSLTSFDWAWQDFYPGTAFYEAR